MSLANHEVWYAIPSASLERCRQTLPRWREMGYKVAVLQDKVRGDVPADIIHRVDAYPGWAASVNLLCKQVVPPSASIVVTGGCDMLPDPNHSAQQLAQQFFERFPDGFGVMQPHGDAYGNAALYCGSPFLGRRWIDTMYQGSGPLHEGYWHNWGDCELYWVAKCLGALWCRTDLTHEHRHFFRSGEAPPTWWTDSAVGHDRRDNELFLTRKWFGFPGHEPLGLNRRLDASLLATDSERLAERHFAGNYGPGSCKDQFEEQIAHAIACFEREGAARLVIRLIDLPARLLADAIMSPKVEIAGFVSESATPRTLWGYPCLPLDEWHARGVRHMLVAGYSPQTQTRCAPEFDALAERGIRTRFASFYGPSTPEKNLRVAAALQKCAVEGRTRVALFGAGTHTTDLAPTIASAPVEVVGVIDDRPEVQGRSVAGLPIRSIRQILESQPDAVILSSDRFERQLWRRSKMLRDAGVHVIALYGEYHDAA
ncbi:MAG: hypothetical protein SFY96_09010 [Planctomycetota bacterium]|nr:hypothetical protein [Planctomycetota bacterium]